MSIKRNDTDVAIIRDIQNVKNGAYLLIFAMLGASGVINWNMLRDNLSPPTTQAEIPLYICTVLLMLLVVGLIILWIAATLSEMIMWAAYLEFKQPRSQTYMAMYGLSVVLGLMGAAVLSTFIVFALYFSIYLLFNYWTQWLANNYYSRSRDETKAQDSKHACILKAMDSYWLRRPQLGRIATMMFFSLFSVIIWLFGEVNTDHAKRQLGITARVIMILTIIIGEAFISAWRWRRDNDIEYCKKENSGDSLTNCK